MVEATIYFRPREQRLHRQFHVGSALRLRRDDPVPRTQAPPGSRRGHTGRATLATAFRSRKATGTAARIIAPVRANAAG